MLTTNKASNAYEIAAIIFSYNTLTLAIIGTAFNLLTLFMLCRATFNDAKKMPVLYYMRVIAILDILMLYDWNLDHYRNTIYAFTIVRSSVVFCRYHTNQTMDVIVFAPTEHCHASKTNLVPVLELKNKIKARAAETEESSSTILHSAMRSFPLDAAGQLPQTNLSVLKTCKHWFVDGTFKMRPEYFYQVLPLHGLFKSEIIPLVLAEKKPLFPIEIWNVYDRTIANLPRSNNSIKGWHNAFTKCVAIVHPTITKLIEKIRREQSKFEGDIVQTRQGQESKPQKLKYRKLDERIKRLVDDYANVDLGEYLKGLAVNIFVFVVL
ncbi:unnamed protein product [Rotaria socialis]|uniref:Uncharacterized protein n=2 Tax=Rotaria socialis TaxID=392032 RepID=A0A820JPG0_9BILA|nr:unnamed protein product [Rotaria socialis]CAF4784584.1 unnamed protein product [Rotaria socialis]